MRTAAGRAASMLKRRGESPVIQTATGRRTCPPSARSGPPRKQMDSNIQPNRERTSAGSKYLSQDKRLYVTFESSSLFVLLAWRLRLQGEVGGSRSIYCVLLAGKCAMLLAGQARDARILITHCSHAQQSIVVNGSFYFFTSSCL